MSHGIRFNLSEALFLKDPQDTKYGRNLLEHAIILFHDIGFEDFNFKKLAQLIQSTEASIYRYFENKHFLLLYLTCWYWEWVNYLIDINTRNINDPSVKLKIAIHNIVNASTESALTSYINENLLHQVVINEGIKSYHIRNVDKENQLGVFHSYKNVVDRVGKIITEVKPGFQYSKSLASNLFEMANNQIYFSEHLPRLTDIKEGETNYDQLEEMMVYFCGKILS